jgi:hypothetical protein
MKRAKKHMVGRQAWEILALTIEAEMKERGIYQEWLYHICAPAQFNNDNFLATDYDWPLRATVWMLAREEMNGGQSNQTG